MAIYNSYGFDGSIPQNAVAGVYDSENSEWTGVFYFSNEDAENADIQLDKNGSFSIEEVNDSGWVGSI